MVRFEIKKGNNYENSIFYDEIIGTERVVELLKDKQGIALSDEDFIQRLEEENRSKEYSRVSSIVQGNEITYNFMPKSKTNQFTVTINSDAKDYNFLKNRFDDIETSINIRNKKEIKALKVKKLAVAVAEVGLAAAIVAGGMAMVGDACNGYEKTNKFVDKLTRPVYSIFTNDEAPTEKAFNEMIEMDIENTDQDVKQISQKR